MSCITCGKERRLLVLSAQFYVGASVKEKPSGLDLAILASDKQRRHKTLRVQLIDVTPAVEYSPDLIQVSQRARCSQTMSKRIVLRHVVHERRFHGRQNFRLRLRRVRNAEVARDGRLEHAHGERSRVVGRDDLGVAREHLHRRLRDGRLVGDDGGFGRRLGLHGCGLGDLAACVKVSRGSRGFSRRSARGSRRVVAVSARVRRRGVSQTKHAQNLHGARASAEAPRRADGDARYLGATL
mmetsp:Transcript_13345/g.45674  ORF Transcript_13345/g.45674 Transcript_13345/m.45674 type:complete len:240 (-) Transcript_13345:1065-1784(-)